MHHLEHALVGLQSETTRTVLTSSTQPRVLLYHIHKFDSCKALAARKKTELKTAQLEIRDQDVNKAQLQAHSLKFNVSTTYIALKSSGFLIK